MIACLLPARNAEAEIGGWLESATGFADAIVALDDGSTDRTAELLRAEPPSPRCSRTSERPGYGDWDDGANRRRLLAAAASSSPTGSSSSTPTSESTQKTQRRSGSSWKATRSPPCAYGLTMFDEVAPGKVELPPRTVYRAFAWRAGPRAARTSDSTSTRSQSRSPMRRTCRRPSARATSHRPSGAPSARRSTDEADPAGRLGPRPSRLRAGLRSRGVALARSRAARPFPPRHAAGFARLGRIAGDPAHARLPPARPKRRGRARGISRLGQARLPMRSWRWTTAARTAPRRSWSEPRESKSSTPNRRATRMRAGMTGATGRSCLDAARRRGFDWVLYLDADERISPDDAAACAR